MKQNSANCGSIDESERAFGATERAIAELLEREGKNVKALAEKTDGGRNPDAEMENPLSKKYYPQKNRSRPNYWRSL